MDKSFLRSQAESHYEMAQYHLKQAYGELTAVESMLKGAGIEDGDKLAATQEQLSELEPIINAGE